MSLSFFTNASVLVGMVAGFVVTLLLTTLPHLLYAVRTGRRNTSPHLSLALQLGHLFLGALFGYFCGGLVGFIAGARLTEMYGPLLGLMGGNIGGITGGIFGGCIKISARNHQAL